MQNTNVILETVSMYYFTANWKMQGELPWCQLVNVWILTNEIATWAIHICRHSSWMSWTLTMLKSCCNFPSPSLFLPFISIKMKEVLEYFTLLHSCKRWKFFFMQTYTHSCLHILKGWMVDEAQEFFLCIASWW